MMVAAVASAAMGSCRTAGYSVKWAGFGGDFRHRAVRPAWLSARLAAPACQGSADGLSTELPEVSVKARNTAAHRKTPPSRTNPMRSSARCNGVLAREQSRTQDADCGHRGALAVPDVHTHHDRDIFERCGHEAIFGFSTCRASSDVAINDGIKPRLADWRVVSNDVAFRRAFLDRCAQGRKRLQGWPFGDVETLSSGGRARQARTYPVAIHVIR